MIDFLCRSRSSTHAEPRWANDETVSRAGVWVAAAARQYRALDAQEA